MESNGTEHYQYIWTTIQHLFLKTVLDLLCNKNSQGKGYSILYFLRCQLEECFILRVCKMFWSECSKSRTSDSRRDWTSKWTTQSILEGFWPVVHRWRIWHDLVTNGSFWGQISFRRLGMPCLQVSEACLWDKMFSDEIFCATFVHMHTHMARMNYPMGNLDLGIKS